MRVDDNFPALVNEAPTAHLDRRESAGKRSGIFKLWSDGVFSVRADIAKATATAKGTEGPGVVGIGAGTAAELHRRQPFAENIGPVELRIDLQFPRSVHVSPPAHAYGSQAFGKTLRPLELRIDHGLAGVVNKPPATVDDHGI